MLLLAEVADKSLLPDYPILTGVCIAVAVVISGAFLAIAGRGLACIPVLLALAFPAVWIAEVTEATIGPLVVAELGTEYFIRLIAGFTVPYLLAIFALVPISHTAAKWGRQQRGLCTTCSYDLRGLTTDRCPECGNPVPTLIDRTPAP